MLAYLHKIRTNAIEFNMVSDKATCTDCYPCGS